MSSWESFRLVSAKRVEVVGWAHKDKDKDKEEDNGESQVAG